MLFLKFVMGKVRDARGTGQKSVVTSTKDGRSGQIDDGNKVIETLFRPKKRWDVGNGNGRAWRY